MTLTIELTPEQQAALEAEAMSQGVDLPEFARLRLLENLPAEGAPRTAGAQLLQELQEAGAFNPNYGDPNMDSTELARAIREGRFPPRKEDESQGQAA